MEPDHDRTPLQHVSTAYGLAFVLDRDPRFDGDPCRGAFRIACGILVVLFGQDRADAINQWVHDTNEFDMATLEELVERATPSGCKCDICIKAHLRGNYTPVRHGVRDIEGGWIRWAVFNEVDVSDVLLDVGDNNLDTVAWSLTTWVAGSRPGLPSTDQPVIKVGKAHTLITQRGHYVPTSSNS